jgi:hypothetical protein
LTALTKQTCEQLGRQRRWPASTPTRVPHCSPTPRQDAKDSEDCAVAVATLAAARPRHTPRAPAAHPRERGTEAPSDPSDGAEQTDHADHASERPGRNNGDYRDRRHAVGVSHAPDSDQGRIAGHLRASIRSGRDTGPTTGRRRRRVSFPLHGRRAGRRDH